MKLFDRFKQGLKKTSQLLDTDIRDLLKQEGRLVDEQLLDELFAVLVKTDMGSGPAQEIRDLVRSEFRGRVVQSADILAKISVKLNESLDQHHGSNDETV